MTKYSDTLLDPNELKVISIFEKKLEHIFSCDTKVIVSPYGGDQLNLIIEIHPNFSLAEIIALFRLRNYSNHWTALNSLILKFKNEVLALRPQLADDFDIEEVYIALKNTSIAISSIYKNSIVDEIIFIMYSIIQHFDNYANVGAVPSAIHIPIFEDLTIKEFFGEDQNVSPTFFDSPYSKFWGLYFDHLKKPIIYDLTRSCIIPGEIDLNLD